MPAPAATGGTRYPLIRLGWAAATVVLLGLGTVRAAGWLFALCFLTALVTGVLAVAGGTSVGGMLTALVGTVFAPLRAIPWGVRGVGALRRAHPSGGLPFRLLVAIALSAVLLLVFGALFASADAAFEALLGRVLPEVDGGTIARWIFVGTVVGFATLGAAYVVSAPPDLSGLESTAKRRAGTLEWAIPLATLNALFLAFVLVQLTVLFGGERHVLETAGLTYAEYARSGFWQLLTVTALTLLVLAGAARWAPRDTPVLTRVLLGGLAALSLVVVASALYRMSVYEEAYGFTRLRLLVSACELWLGLVFVMVLVAGVRLRARWLPSAALAAGVAALITLGALNPDGFIAERNIERYRDSGKIDVGYLSTLSADAVPALDRLPATLRGCALVRIETDLRADPDDWRGWNLGRHRARTLLAADPAGVALSSCPGRDWWR